MRPTWLGSVLAIVLLAAPLRAGAAGRPGGSPTTCDGSWSIVPSPNAVQSDNILRAVATIGPSDVWAVGMQRHLGPERAMAMHWDGAAWTIVHTPSRRERNTELVSVDAIATDDVWAVGNAYGRDVVPVALHWNGEHWREREP